jgi:hypothetical protein
MSQEPHRGDTMGGQTRCDITPFQGFKNLV